MLDAPASALISNGYVLESAPSRLGCVAPKRSGGATGAASGAL